MPASHGSYERRERTLIHATHGHLSLFHVSFKLPELVFKIVWNLMYVGKNVISLN